MPIMNIGPSSPIRSVHYLPVWEARLRLWHWANALTILLLFESYLLFDWHKELGFSKATTITFQKVHIYLGYLFILLFLGRIYLLFRGNSFSRLPEIIPDRKGESWGRTLIREIHHHLSPPRNPDGTLHPPADPGHNQLARFLYLPLFFVIIPIQSLSGLLWSSVKWGFWPAPFLKTVSRPLHHTLNQVLSNIHAAGMYVLLAFIAGHLGGIVLHEITFRSDILSSMIHGDKPLTKQEIEDYRKIEQSGESME
ncbi:MAG: cytochrome b/b6 domain-containing protein [Leptospirales bacterium]